MATIEEYTQKCKDHEEKTGKYLSYGKCVAMHPEMKTKTTSSVTVQRPSGTWLSENEKKEIERQFLNGRQVKDIAASVGVSKPTVVNNLKAMGIIYTYEPPKNWTTEEEDLLRDFYFHDIPVSDIAGMLQRTECSIRSKINKLGLNVQKKNRSGTAIPKATSKIICNFSLAERN